MAALGARRPQVPKLLIWDNAPPHQTHLVRQTAKAAGIVLGWLPFRSPELNPCEDLWRRLKAVAAKPAISPSVAAEPAATRMNQVIAFPSPLSGPMSGTHVSSTVSASPYGYTRQAPRRPAVVSQRSQPGARGRRGG